MAGNINAIGLIVVVTMTAALLIFAQWRTWSLWRFLLNVGASFCLAIVSATLSAHMCKAGSPLSQWAIPSACLALVLTFVANARLRGFASMLLVVASIGLSFHFSELVHWKGYTGNPAGSAITQHGYLLKMDYMLEQCCADAAATASPGRLIDVISLPEDARQMAEHPPAFHRSAVYWHTWLTGIYPVVLIPTETWFIGGASSNAATRLGLRVRP